MTKRTLAITLITILSLILSSVSTYASAWINTPTDENNPVLTVEYKRADPNNQNKPYNQLSIYFEKNEISGVIALDGILYELNKTYTVKQQHEDETGYFISENKLYKFNLIGGTTPISIIDPATGQRISGGEFSYTYELIQTNEKPKYSTNILTIKHNNATKNTTEKYFIDGKETTRENYQKEKTGVYSEKVSTKYLKDNAPIFNNKTETFTGITEQNTEITWSDGTKTTVVKPIYNFQIDEYYTVTQEYIKSYELTKLSTKINQSKPQTQTAKPTNTKQTINVKIKSFKVKTTKGKFTAKWEKISAKDKKKISQIQVQYSNNSKFSKAKTYNVSKNSTGKTVKNLKKGTYYIRARVVNGNAIGPWTSAKQIKTK